MTGDRSISRRGLLRSGGVTISLGAIIAACSSAQEGAPGRVGNAPVVTPLPDPVVNDAVLLRTATSLEYTAIDVYATATELGVLDGSMQQVIDRFVADHTEHAELTASLTAEAGGEPYECANSWIMDRAVAPMLNLISGDEAAGIEPSDDPARDLLAVSEALETLAGATYQELVGALADPQLRRQLALIGAQEVRHAAVVAMRKTGTPEAYLSPALAGEEVTPDESGLTPVYAVPGRFGSLAATELVIGAPNDAGIRATVLLQTPAGNSFVYPDQTCQ